MNNHPRRKRGLLTGLAAVATALTLAFSAAHAQAEDVVPAQPASIDAQATATLTIHKYKQPNEVRDQKHSTGLPLDAKDVEGWEPLEGIKFSAQRVNTADGKYDLTRNEGWENAAKLDVADAPPLLVGSPVESAATDGTGLTSITDLPVGLYYVTETLYGPEVTPAVPFLVTLPMTNPESLSTWLYNVHVYPKNATTTATKTVVDEDSVKLGDTVEWTILSDIPKAKVIDKYTIVDELDSKLEYSDLTVSLTGDSKVTLIPEVDYTITQTPPSTGTLEFTDTGRAKLASAWQVDPNAQVKSVISTKVIKVGVIENTATVFPNSTSAGVKTSSVQTKFGNIVLNKVDAKTGEELSKAEFQVFLSEADAKSKTNPIKINEGMEGEQSTFTSDENGIVLIEGLRYSNFQNGSEIQDKANWRYYWIAETKAPSGYELLAEPIKVSVTSFEETVSVEVKNVPKNAGFALPMTGASGATTIIMVAGLLLLLAGTAAVVVSRRKKGQAQA